MHWNKLVNACLALSMFMLVGCAAHRMEPTGQSGFLSDYSKLTQGAEGEAAERYIKPGVDWKKYNKVLITPVVFYMKPGEEKKPIDPDQMKELSDYFNQSMIKAFQDGYTIVQQPGPGVLIIRSAITDIKPGAPVRGTLSSIVPIGIALSSLGKAATGEYASVGQAEAESEILDGQTKMQLAAAVDRRAGTKAPFRSSLEDAENAFDYWTHLMRTRLDQLRGVPTPEPQQ